MTPGSKPRAAIYLRLSRDRDGETSTARQEKGCRSWAKANGYAVAEVYADVGLSGFKRGVQRPSFDRLLADVAAGSYEAVIVWKLDRVTRQGLRALGRLLDVLDEGGAKLVSATEGLDTSTGMGEMIAGLLAGIAKQESENISVRTRSAKAHGAAAGRPNGGGRRPFGYADQTFSAVVDREAKVLHELADRVLAGESLRALAADLDARGVKTTSGGRWTSANLGNMLRSPHLAGLRVHDGREVEGTWPAIFTRKTHESLNAARGHYRPARVNAHLLTGMLRCALCEGPMHTKTTARFGFQYACRKCGRVIIRGEMLEELIGKAVLEALDADDVARALSEQASRVDLGAIADSLAADRESLSQLSRDHYVTRVVSRDVFLASAAELEQRIAEADAMVRQAERTRDQGMDAETLAALWQDGQPAKRRQDRQLAKRRAVLRALVESITVAPSKMRGRNAFDPGRVEIVWRY